MKNLHNSITHKLGQIHITDCLDKNIGLPSLRPNSFDMCFTDPKFNIDYGKTSKTYKGKKLNWVENKNYYNDIMSDDDYYEFSKKWFEAVSRVCKFVLIHCGYKNESMWYDIKKPDGKIYKITPNTNTNGNVSYLARITPILIYGKLNNKFNLDTFTYNSNWGFLKRNDYTYTHPCPLSEEFVYNVIKQQKPRSVLDIFMGSGTTARACIRLGIKFFGYEINSEYYNDLNYSLTERQVELKQKRKKLW